ncbi:MAG: PQQ-binding-like beta-propeller repeat protein [Verrucomicrobiota bacterium]|nr:PQQ-binding-like beta-propeller repeat protein [Verrucomicrobiota bacterium]
MKLRLPSLLVALSLAAAPSDAATKPKPSAKKTTTTTSAPAPADAVTGWLQWRGPDQNGTSRETGLLDKVDANAPLWTADFPGQSAPTIANGQLYINGYLGEGPDVQEVVACFDAETGKKLWEHRWSDFLSDTIYLRYATSSPTIDPETGNVYVQGTQGLFACFTRDGKLLWQHSMMEEFGRMTFPNARTASPLIDKELVITRGITSAWGANGPAGDRFYAFDKKTGELVWLSAPGDRPQDNTFSNPLLTWLKGKRVLIAAGGDSTIVCLNARSGDPLFRFPVARAGAKGGINAAVLRYKDSLLVIHESENLDTSEVGRSAAYKIPPEFTPPEPGKPQVFEQKPLELWRNPLGSLASSPCLVGNRMYEVTGVGELACIDADTGKVLWRQKLGVEQRQSSPLYADGKLYIAFYTASAGEEPAQPGTETSGGNGALLIVKPSDKGAQILSRTFLQGRCYGSPVAYNGKLYVQTDRKLYAFGKKGDNKGVAAQKAIKAEEWPKPGAADRLQLIPNEVLLRPAQTASVRVRTLDANGFTVEEAVDKQRVKFDKYIPPTALVKTSMKGLFNDAGDLVADPEPVESAGAFQAKLAIDGKELTGTMRGRVLPNPPLKLDFENAELNLSTDKPPAPAVPNTMEKPTPFAYPPLPWNGARFRFEIRQAPGEGGTKALCKTIDDKRFQRGQVFIGHPDAKNYTIEADVLTEGDRRKRSEIGLINQRYLIQLKGNGNQLEISSNQERIRESVPFVVTPNEWYHLKTRVDVAADGSGAVRAKAWKKKEPEPEAWTLEVKHRNAHTHGSPGFFSLAPAEQRAWIDNIEVRPN